MRFFIAVAVAVALGTPAVAQGQDGAKAATSADSIDAVSSGGYWKDGVREGTFRVLILREGYESIRYIAVLQWLENNRGRSASIVATKRLNALAPNCYSLLEPRFTLRDGKWFLAFRGSSEPLKQATQPVEFAFGRLGEVTLGKSCASAF